MGSVFVRNSGTSAHLQILQYANYVPLFPKISL